MGDVVTIILAGGQGSRLYPLTKIRSKPAVPIAGRFRLVDISISNCLHSGLRKIFILTQFATESLHRHLFLTYRFDEFTKGFLTVLSAQQTLDNRLWYQGTADAVRQNLPFLEAHGDLVLILSGDHLYRMDYSRFIEFHRRRRAEITISVSPVAGHEAGEFGVMKLARNGRITAFFEKPKTSAEVESMKVEPAFLEGHGLQPDGRTHLASMGVYLFNWRALRELLNRTDAKDFGREVIPRAIADHRVYGFPFDGYWRDIGTIRSFYEANLDLTEPLPKFNFYDEDKPIFTHARFLRGRRSWLRRSTTRSSARAASSTVPGSAGRSSASGPGSGTTPGSNGRSSWAPIISSRGRSQRNARLGRPDIGIGRNCVIRAAIIDKNARIGDGAKLVNAAGAAEAETDDYVIRDGIIVVPKHAVIPPGAVV